MTEAVDFVSENKEMLYFRRGFTGGELDMKPGFVSAAGVLACAFLPLGCGSSRMTQQAVPADVYVAGIDGTSAVIWKNGVETVLAQNAAANAIAVSGSDVYAGGMTDGQGPTPPHAVIWKNGAGTTLSSTYSQVNGLVVANGNVYAVGTAADSSGLTGFATVWTNGQSTYLKDGNYPNGSIPFATEGDAITVSGTDVYVAGSAMQCTPQGSSYDCGMFPVYWKNGTATNLGQISPQNFGSFATGIGVAGSNVYVSGVTGTSPLQAVYWQNGTQVPLNLPTGPGSITVSLAASGSDVYVTGGNDGSIAGYWANSSFTTLGIGTNTQYTITSGIALNGSDVYIAGSLISPQGSQSSALYWKNGMPVQLPSNSTQASALAIVVVPQQAGT